VRRLSLLFCLLVCIASFCCDFGAVVSAQESSRGYRKASEGDDVVKDKLFPKKGRVEINGPNVGGILNQSYLTSIVVNGGLSYFANEEWGFGIEGLVSSNKDSDARYCLEHFHNNPDQVASPPCDNPTMAAGSTFPEGSRVNYGPAYVPIREVNSAFAATAIWNPVYGKQLFFLSATGYFDLFVTMGAGLLNSTYYPLETTLRNGKTSRGDFPPLGSPGPTYGAGADEVDSYGEAGRPDPVSDSDFMITTGVGQKYHFANRFNFKVEIRNYMLLGTESGFDTFFTLWGGVGMRL
jgi:outer membrane beta-barrel protein